MKRFKKVLALVLAGVLALAMLTACGETDPDKLIPTDGSFEIVQAVNRAAVEAGRSEVTYSVKYSEVTKKLLVNWLANRGTNKYADGYNVVIKELGTTTLLMGLERVDSYPHAVGPDTNPAYKTSKFDASTFVKNESYTSATHIGVAFVQANGQIYRLVCLFSVPKQ